MLSASVGIGSRKNICHKTQTAGQAFTACPAAFSARIESVFLVYGGSTVELLFMTYSSSVHDEIRFSPLINTLHGDSLPAPA